MMKLKQFMFALVAMVLGFSFTASAQELLVNCDYNSSTEGYGVSKFSNYAGAYAYATANAKTATIVIEKTNTASGNCIENNHKDYKNLKVVVNDGAILWVALSKWDMTYAVTVKPGGAIKSARAKSAASYINTHIKSTLTLGEAGASKKATIDFLDGNSYQSGSLAVLYNGKIVANNATIEVGDLGCTGTATFNDCDITIEGVLATGKNNWYKQSMTNTTVTVGGTNRMNENTYYSTAGTLLHNLTLDNSTIAVGNGDGVVVKTVTLKNGSAWTVAEGANVNTDNAKVTVYGSVTVPEELVNNSTANELVSNTAVNGYTPVLPSGVTNLTVELANVETANDATTKLTFNVEPKDASGNKVSETSEITFRLPVPSEWAGKSVKVYHEGVAMAGTYTVQSGNYVEVKSTEFSEFAVELFEPVAKIGDAGYASVKDALNAAKEQGLTNVVITIVGENSSTTADKFDLIYTTTFDNVTIKQENGNKPYYFAGLYTGSRTNNGKFVFDGVNIAVPSNGQYMFEGNVVLSNNSYIKSSAEANCFVYNAEVTVEAGSKIDGVIEDIRGGSLIIDGGKTDGTYCDEPALRDAILIVNWASSNLVLKNGAYVKVNSANEVGRLTVNGKMDVSNSKLESYQYIAVNQGATLTLNAGSIITTKELTGAGAINIDATGITGDVTVIKANLTGFTGAINVEGGSYEITSEGLVVKMPVLSGEGTEANPYLISSVDELVLFRNSVNAGETKYNAEGVYVALDDNIDLAGVDWSVNIGDDCSATFDGIFDGKNFTISNLTATETAQKGDGYICAGLFGAIYGNAVVKNLTLENVTIGAPYAGSNVAAVVGFGYNAKGSIENVKVTGDININAPFATSVGAIVGYDYYGPSLKVVNCEVKGNDGSAIVGKSYVGGVVGYASSKIALNENAVANVSVTGTGSVGAIAGIMLGGSSATDNTVKNVALSATGELWANSAAVVAGTISGGSVTAANTTVESVTANGADAPIVGGVLVEKPTTPIEKVQAKIGNVYFTTIDAAMASNVNGVVDILTDVTIDEAEAKEYTYTKEAKVMGTLTYKRVFVPGYWNTLFVPFEIPMSELYENYDVAYINDMHSYDKDYDGVIEEFGLEVIYIKDEDAILNASHPYVIRPKNEDAAYMELELSDATLFKSTEQTDITCSSAYMNFTFKGSYSKIAVSDTDRYYILALDENGKQTFGYASAGSNLNPYRFYFIMESRGGSYVKVEESAYKAIRINVQGEGDTTGIVGTEFNTNGEDFIYDLQGRRVSNPVKGGIYIVNGKKVYYNK